MKQTKGKLFALATAAAMALLLAACGGGGGSSTNIPSGGTGGGGGGGTDTPKETATATGVTMVVLENTLYSETDKVTITATVGLNGDAKDLPSDFEVKLQNNTTGDSYKMTLDAGKYTYTLQGDSLKSGVYQVVVTPGNLKSVLQTIIIAAEPPDDVDAKIDDLKQLAGNSYATVWAESDVDNDKDGVRDDVQAKMLDSLNGIAAQAAEATTATRTEVAAALQQAAVVYQDAQKAATASQDAPLTEEQAAEIAAKVLRGTECLYAVLGDKAAGEASSMLVAAVSDTEARQAASTEFNQFFGGRILKNTSKEERISQCDFKAGS